MLSTEFAVTMSYDYRNTGQRHPIPAQAPIRPKGGSGRRYDLDWLRVFAFGMLIFYHIGLFYVTWDWLVNSRYSSPSSNLLWD